MEWFKDRNGREVRPESILTWETPNAGTVRAEVIEYGPWHGERVVWVRLPSGAEAPLFARDVAMLEVAR